MAYCCENGKEYSWTEPAFFRFGESWSHGGPKSSKTPLKEEGDCEYPRGDPQETPEPGDPRPGPGPGPGGGVGGVTYRLFIVLQALKNSIKIIVKALKR